MARRSTRDQNPQAPAKEDAGDALAKPAKKLAGESRGKIVHSFLAAAERIKTPLQFAAFLIVAVLAIVFFHKIEPTVIVFVAVVLPFAMIGVLLSDKTFANVKKGGALLIGVVAVLLLIGFGFSAYIFGVLATDSGKPAVSISRGIFSSSVRKRRADEVRNNDIRLDSYHHKYDFLSRFYFSSLQRSMAQPDQGSISMTLHFKQEMETIAAEMAKLRGVDASTVFGDAQAAALLEKLQRSVAFLDFTRHIETVVMTIYGARGPTHTIEELGDTTQWPELTGNEAILDVRFSEVEFQLMKKLGRNFALKSLGSLQRDDVVAVKKAFAELGWAPTSQPTDDEALQRFRNSLERRFHADDLQRPLYALAFSSNRPHPVPPVPGKPKPSKPVRPIVVRSYGDAQKNQIAFYLVIYESGLVDLGRLLTALVPEAARDVVAGVFSTKLDIFDLSDVDRLCEFMIQRGRAKPSSNLDTVAFNLREDVHRRFGDIASGKIIKSQSVEQYVTNGLSFMLSSSADMSRFFGDVEPSEYGKVLRDLLELYNVMESDSVVELIDA